MIGDFGECCLWELVAYLDRHASILVVWVAGQHLGKGSPGWKTWTTRLRIKKGRDDAMLKAGIKAVITGAVVQDFLDPHFAS